jgi:hypothetical protein
MQALIDPISVSCPPNGIELAFNISESARYTCQNTGYCLAYLVTYTPCPPVVNFVLISLWRTFHF